MQELPKQMLLRVEGTDKHGYFCAGAVFELQPTGWKLVAWAPKLGWLFGLQMQVIKNRLESTGYTYSWIR